MRLRLTEELMLLALDDNKGIIIQEANAYINFGMASALLLELAIYERLQLEDGKLQTIKMKPLRDPLLQEAFQVMHSSPKNHSISYWTHELVYKIEDFYGKLLQQLIDKRILAVTEVKVFGLFKRKRYPMINSVPESEIVKRVMNLVKVGANSNARTVMLTSLIGASNLVTTVFAKEEEQRMANERIKDISHNMIAGSEINKLIHDIQEAVGKAVSSHLPIVTA